MLFSQKSIVHALAFSLMIHTTSALSSSSSNLYTTNSKSKSSIPKVHTFYICRHGETDANAAGVIQGSADFSRLTDLGKDQARNLGSTLQNDDSFSVSNNVFLSPLTRARETWEIIKKEMSDDKFLHGRREIIMNNLREIDFHSWEGLHKDVIKAQNPESYAAWKAGDPDNLRVKDTTTAASSSTVRYPLLDLWLRAEKVWDEVHSIELGLLSSSSFLETIQNDDLNKQTSSLLVCHGSLGQALLGSALKKDANFFRSAEFPNCGMVEIEWIIENNNNNFGKVHRWRWIRPNQSDWFCNEFMEYPEVTDTIR